MRFTIGTLMAVMGGITLLGPVVLPSVYDPFAKSMVTFFGLAWMLLGILFWNQMPGIAALRPDARPSRPAGRRSPARPPV